MIDLHSHTTASDGQHSPEELLALARQAGVTVLAVTDHDTVAGLQRAEAAAAAQGITLVNGIELSAFVHGKEVHILGHFLDRADPRLATFQERLSHERRTRMEQMVQNMRGLGYPVSMAEVEALAGGAQLGRPHLARVLVEKGFTTSVKEAFDRWLGDGKPGCVPRFKLSAEEAISLIRGAGGVATVAHPAVSRIDKYDLTEMTGQGLGGLEVEHSDHDPGTRRRMLEWATSLDLVPTAGSDFHGEKIAPGRDLGTASMAQERFEALQARRPTVV